MTKRKLIEWLGIMVVILVFALTGWHKPLIVLLQRGMLQTGLMAPNTEKQPVVSNHGIYNLSLLNENGQSLSLAQFEGKVIFLNLWATWCPPCRAEMPGINSLYRSIQDSNIVFVMLSLDDDFQKAKTYKSEEEFDFPVYYLQSPLPNIYQERSIPRSYVVNPQGELILKHTGIADYDSKKFRELLENSAKGSL